MRRWTAALVTAVLAVLIAPAALSTVQTPSAEPAPADADAAERSQASSQIRLEVFCYTGDLDISQAQAEADCDALSEFGRDWEQTLDVLDADGNVTDTAFPQVLPTAMAVDYQPDGAWRGSDPVLPDGWRVIECPFLGDQDEDITNGVGQVIEAERLPYVDRRHVVCYERAAEEAPTDGETPPPTDGEIPPPTDGEIPLPNNIDTGGGGTADW